MNINRLPMAAVFFIYAILLASCASSFAETPKRVLEEKPLEVVDTGFQFMSGVNPGGPGMPFHVYWLNNDSFIVNALQEIPNANVVKAERTMRVDARTGKSTQIIETGSILWCLNQVRGIGSISPSPFKPILPWKPHQDDVQYRWVSVDKELHIENVKSVPDLGVTTCRPRLYENEDRSARFGLIKTLREPDGYLQLIPPGQRSSPEDTAVWVRPEKPPLPLHILSMEITAGRQDDFLEFSQKYLLNSNDSQGNSSTDGRNGGAYWKRPYDLTPYRLLSLDGTVEEIPYPKVIFDYGLKGLGKLVPTPVGLLISAHNALFLLNGEQLTRIWGKPSRGLFSNSGEYAYNLRLSPNGCKAVFGRVADWKPETRKPISIINLCKGE